MAHIVEEESGTYVPQHHDTHNGYYAGDFSAVPFSPPNLGVLVGTTAYAA